MNFEKIIVPTDFSPCSMAAVSFAASLAKNAQSEIHLVHIIEVPDMAPVFPITPEFGGSDLGVALSMDMSQNMMEDARKKMDTFIKHPEFEGLLIKPSVELGSTSDLINFTAQKYKADMIVMCAHGNGGENDFFIGSNAEKLIRSSSIPVLTIKNKVQVPKKIVFASDFTDESSHIFSYVKAFSEIFQAKIHLLKVNTLEKFETTRESRTLIENFIKTSGLKEIDYTIYNDLILESGIVNFIKDENADMIALGTHNSHFFDHLFSKSLTEELLNHCGCPVLTVNIERVH